MLSAGPIATVDDNPVEALDLEPLGPRRDGRHVELLNTGSAPGEYSLDDGASWCHLPADFAVTKDGVTVGNKLLVRRLAGGANLSGVYLSAW